MYYSRRMNDSNINRENLKPADLQLVKEVNKRKKENMQRNV